MNIGEPYMDAFTNGSNPSPPSVHLICVNQYKELHEKEDLYEMRK